LQPPIHPTASVAPGARLGAGVRVGPFAVIEDETEIGDDCEIAAHAVIKRHTRMGPHNRIGEHAVIGGAPQDLAFKGHRSYLVIGTGNVIREGATLHRSSRQDETTTVGDHCYLMAYAHVGHDCRLGNQVIVANGALLAGFVEVGDRAFVSGNVAIHQFTRVGRMAMVGGLARVSQDCLPFMITEGSPARARGVNVVGLRRAGVSAGDVRALKNALGVLRAAARLEEALAALATDASPLVRELGEFIRGSARGFAHPTKR
jgi:UDP-N-acetylglucosamine acyltransferase